MNFKLLPNTKWLNDHNKNPNVLTEFEKIDINIETCCDFKQNIQLNMWKSKKIKEKWWKIRSTHNERKNIDGEKFQEKE